MRPKTSETDSVPKKRTVSIYGADDMNKETMNWVIVLVLSLVLCISHILSRSTVLWIAISAYWVVFSFVNLLRKIKEM